MTEIPQKRVLTVRYSDGGTFQTSANTASEYMLTPNFMRFFFLCVILYAAIVQNTATVLGGDADTLPFAASLVLWGSVMTSALVMLIFCVWINLMLVSFGILKAIYTPLLLLPVVVLNTVIIHYALLNFGTSYNVGFNSVYEIGIRNVLIIVCFDIIHGRYVAPQHPNYIPPDEPDETRLAIASTSLLTDASGALVQGVAAPIDDNNLTPDFDKHADEIATKVKISRQFFDPEEIVSIKSEDHYLKIQLRDNTVMLRGKLSETVDLLGDHLGIQINRSVWVSFAAIQDIEKEKAGNIYVRLNDGDRYRVAKSRQLIFEDRVAQVARTQPL